jgi:hypothetical protein
MELYASTIHYNNAPAIQIACVDRTLSKLAQEQLERFVTASPALLYVLRIEGQKARQVWISENLRA